VPTYTTADRFWRDWNKLTTAQQARFRDAVQRFVQGFTSGEMPPGLRIKHVEGTDGIFELTWAPDGRATWQFGEEQVPGEPHIVWRRIGTHDIFKTP
jgi:hypothetical protein